MGETRGCRPPERPTYPGLVRPYTDENDYVNQPKFIAKKMSKTVIPECVKHDPFSIYDDDSAHDHYFFLPAGKLDLSNFKSTPSLRDTSTTTSRTTNNKCGSWSRSSPDNQRVHLKNTNSQTSSHCQCKTQTQQQHIRHIHNCRRNINTSDSKSSLITNKTKRPSSGEYCSLSADAVAPKYPGIIRTHDPPIDEESFRKFALKLVNSNCSSDINQNSNDYHNPARTKNESNVDCCDVDSISKTKNYNMNKCIDQCTCMVCIKAGRYHWAGDTDSFVEEPCSCIGTRKNIVGRWFCMGVVALFLPCLVCYLPAKLCQNSCSSTRCTKTKLKNKQCIVKYVNEPNEKIEDNALL